MKETKVMSVQLDHRVRFETWNLSVSRLKKPGEVGRGLLNNIEEFRFYLGIVRAI